MMQVIIEVQGGVSSYYHLDRLGSVRLVTQPASQQAFSAKYLPYGNTYATSGAEAFQYTGKQFDVATGLLYYGYRYYDSQSGRFITVDLVQANYLNPQSLNRYTYALDNPNRYSDPDGAKLPDAAYDIGRVAGASAEKSWEELDKEQREIVDAYEEYASHHSHPMQFRAWLKMTFRASASTGPSDPAAPSISKNMMLKITRMENYLSASDPSTATTSGVTTFTGTVTNNIAQEIQTITTESYSHLILEVAIVAIEAVAIVVGIGPWGGVLGPLPDPYTGIGFGPQPEA